MAKLKKTARKSTSSTSKDSSKTESKAQAEKLGNSITESAQQIWLAGMGAFNRAQAEGGKLFESLVRDGLSLEKTARKFAGNRAEIVRDVVEGRVDQAKERAADTWDKLEGVFEDRVQRALIKLGVPGREDLSKLSARVEQLTAELRKANGQPAKTVKAAKAPKVATAPKAPRKATKKAASKTAAARPVVKAPTKKPRKTGAKAAAKPSAAE